MKDRSKTVLREIGLWAKENGLTRSDIESLLASEIPRPRIHRVKLICQGWEESERGWGVRPDGYSLHKDLAACTAFRNAYWNRMPKEAPDEYSRESGTPFECELDSTDPRVKSALKGTGQRFFDHNMPAGAKDGWVPVK